MKKSKYSEQQIISLLKEVELGAKVADVCRKYGISEATCYKWKAAYGGMDVSKLGQLDVVYRNRTVQLMLFSLNWIVRFR